MRFLQHIYHRDFHVRKRMNSNLILFSFIGMIVVTGCSPTEPTFPAAPKSGSIVFTNSSSQYVTMFCIRKNGTEQWGTNYLSGGYYISPGYYITMVVPVGAIDVRIESANSLKVWTFTNHAIEENGSYPLVVTD